MSLSPLESRLHYEFRNAELLRQAITHRSYSATHNERLEFLGDSILNCVVAALLFQRFNKLDEGDLSRVRAHLVKEHSLYEIAQTLNISEVLRLGEGEFRSGGFRRPSILADTFEALLGAIFLDGGFYQVQAVIKRLYAPILDKINPCILGKDAKTLLQEYLQSHKIALPRYAIIAIAGAAHKQQFEVECAVPKLDIRVFGTGVSRRTAEQTAASKALEKMITIAPHLLSKLKRLQETEPLAYLEPKSAQLRSSGMKRTLNVTSVLGRKAKRLEKLSGQVMQAMRPSSYDHKFESSVVNQDAVSIMTNNKGLTVVRASDVLLTKVAPAITTTTALDISTELPQVLHEIPDIEPHLPHLADFSI
ncbi:Ribonuclease 3 [Candidatus Vallotia lariciata]|nr:Ribonuclease 3 [Candidatus Vallotia lariciata]